MCAAVSAEPLVYGPVPSRRLGRSLGGDVVGGMIAFRNGYPGQLWLEVMLLAGVTGMVAEVERLAELAARIAPDRIQLNTAVRPPAESFVAPVPDSSLQAFAGLFTPHAEVIADILPAGD